MSFLDLINISPKGNIGGIEISATLEEVFTDSIQLTDHPIELGAAITDHAYKRPIELVMRCGFSNSSASSFLGMAAALLDSGSMSGSSSVDDLYSQFLALQASLVPFSVVTSRRKFDNMVITSLATTTDARTSNALFLTVNLRQVIIVQTRVTTMPPSANQATPASTAETENLGRRYPAPATPAPGGSAPPTSSGGATGSW